MTKCNYLKLLAIILAVFFITASLTSPASAWSSAAVQGMGILLSGDPSSGEPAEPADEIKPENSGEKKKEGGTCGPEAIFPVETCEAGQGALCINTLPLSVVDENIIIKGTVDKRSSAFSHLKAYVQHEYTKALNEIKLDKIASENCWDEDWAEDSDACIDSKGFFAILIPVSQLGPYTIMIDSVSLDGEAVSRTVRTSRVVAPKIAKEDIKVDPDPGESSGLINASKVNIDIDLLHDCKFCDFIGTSTGGVMVTVVNTIRSPDGGVKKIVRRGNIASGGKFLVCMPVLEGTNELTVEACNAATGEDCPRVEGISFSVGSSGSRIRLVSPDDSKMVFDSRNVSEIPLKFALSGYSHQDGVCSDGDVTVTWNRNGPVSLCPDESGVYETSLVPEVGINVGTIEVSKGDQKISDSFVVGWGRLVNPYSDPESGWIKDAFGLHIGSEYVNETLRPIVNDFLNSDNFKLFVSTFLAGSGKPEEDKAGDDEKKREEAKMSEIKSEIPYCEGGSGMSGGKIEIVGEPALKWGELERLQFDTSGIGFKLDLEGLEVHLKYFRDDDKDGRPDTTFLPLLISFRGVQVDGKIKVMPDGKPLFLISSDNTNCSYQSRSYCVDKPALIVPANMVGGATKGGAFVRCDDKGQQQDDDMHEKCVSLNILNAQSGLINREILNLINDMIYCDGSTYLTYMLREKIKDISQEISFLPGRSMWAGGGLDIVNGRAVIDDAGLSMIAAGRFGGEDILQNLDSRAADEGAGVFLDPVETPASIQNAGTGSVSIALSTAWLNELLYQLAFQKEGNGFLDWEIDDTFLEGFGFDPVKECDAFMPTSEVQTPPVLCQLRPRVGDLLGISLTTNGYFLSKHPIRVVLKGGRRLAPHLKIYRADVPYELPPKPGEEEARYEYKPADVLEVQIPDLEISFYALEVDEEAGKDSYGNPRLLLDEGGRPVIRSMIDGASPPAPITRVKATIILSLEVGNFETSSGDTAKIALRVRPIPSFTKIVFKSVEGGNTTMVPDASLLSTFREKINYGIEIYGDPKDPIVLEIPKTIGLGFMDQYASSEFLSYLGIGEIYFGAGDLSLGFDHTGGRINISLSPRFK